MKKTKMDWLDIALVVLASLFVGLFLFAVSDLQTEREAEIACLEAGYPGYERVFKNNSYSVYCTNEQEAVYLYTE